MWITHLHFFLQYCPNGFYFCLLILGWNMSWTWRRGLLLTSRNPVRFPDWVEALLTHFVCSTESLMMNCWALRWEGHYLLGAKQLSSHWLRGGSIFPHSLTMWEWAADWVFREDWEASKKTLWHIHWKISRGGLKDCKLKSMYVLIVFHGPLFLLMPSFWVHALWFCLIELLPTFHCFFNGLTSHMFLNETLD